MKKKPRKTSKSNKVLLTIIIVIAAGVFIFSGIKLLTILKKKKKGSNAYKQIEDLSGKTDRKDDSETVFFDVPALKAENSDTKGYLYAKDVLSYPVVQCDNNSYYLDHLFDGTPNACGCLFIDCALTEGFESRNCVIYGHDMNVGTMFAPLLNYTSKSFAQQHSVIQLETEQGVKKYSVYAAAKVKSNDMFYNLKNAPNKAFFEQKIKDISQRALYTIGNQLKYGQKLITLSTCTNDGQDNRLIVVAVQK